jgi:hypothetical protein
MSSLAHQMLRSIKKAGYKRAELHRDSYVYWRIFVPGTKKGLACVTFDAMKHLPYSVAVIPNVSIQVAFKSIQTHSSLFKLNESLIDFSKVVKVLIDLRRGAKISRRRKAPEKRRGSKNDARNRGDFFWGRAKNADCGFCSHHLHLNGT